MSLNRIKPHLAQRLRRFVSDCHWQFWLNAAVSSVITGKREKDLNDFFILYHETLCEDCSSQNICSTELRPEDKVLSIEKDY